MIYLSKITFINSANIPYAEIMTDGNVHFTGTQGVGKSTLLRAVLFFYNADTQHLGIRKQGQRGFVDFYLSNPDSYIIYEVERDGERPFSVIVFRQHSRAAYRFVDAPFQREWIIDADGHATADPAEIRRRIQKQGTDLTNIVQSYTEYLDILYGNSHARVSKDKRKYHILESTQYQNIPRIIQNVFLNERVDADFIKDTIIRSMSAEEEHSIRLAFFRNQLADFNDVYNDTMLWVKPNRKGEIETLTRAKNIMSLHNSLMALEYTLRELCGNLNYAVEHAEKSIPLLSDETDRLRIELDKANARIEELAIGFNSERDKLNKELGDREGKIKECRRLHKKYQETDIESRISFAEKKPYFLERRTQLTDQRNLLQREYDDIVRKYDDIVSSLRISLTSFETKQKERVATRKEALNENIGILQNERTAAIGAMDADFRDRRESIDSAMMSAQEKINQLDMEIFKILSSHPMDNEIQEASARINKLESEERELKGVIEKTELEISAETKDLDNKELSINARFNPELEELRRKLKEIECGENRERELLDAAKGSLCEWLDANMPDWSETIGKVADEKNVLYSSSLSPSLTPEGNRTSLFGVDIDLSALDRRVRTPSEIQESLDILASDRKAIQTQIVAKTDELGSVLDKERQKYSGKIKILKESRNAASQKLAVVPQRLKQARLSLSDLQEEEKTRIETQAQECRNRKGDAAVELENIKNIRQELDNARRRKRKGIDKDFSSRIATLKDDFTRFKADVDTETKAFREETAMKIKEHERNRDAELRKEGADVDMLDKVKSEYEANERNLSRIEADSELIFNYRKDYRDYISKEGELKLDKQKLEARLETLKDRYSLRREKLASAKRKLENEISDKDRALKELEHGLRRTRDFMESRNCPDFIGDCGKIKTSKGCSETVDDIRDNIQIKASSLSELKNCVNEFRRFFSPRNTFKFPSILDTDSDYMEYAESIDDFVSNDKIREHQLTSNNIYRDILSRIAVEFSEMVEKESEIQKVIKEVNYDFSRKTFAGVIRGIELRLERSQMPIISQMQEILDFCTENMEDLGEVNLFSGEGRAEVNQNAVEVLKRLNKTLNDNSEIDDLMLSDTFSLKFKIEENDNSTGWIDNIRMIGSDGTDILVKAIINILLINVFKQRLEKKAGEFTLHCMMDEIGKLADENIQGILDFANRRNIFIINSSPKVHRPLSYRHLYLLSKDASAKTIIQPILSTRQAALK